MIIKWYCLYYKGNLFKLLQFLDGMCKHHLCNNETFFKADVYVTLPRFISYLGHQIKILVISWYYAILDNLMKYIFGLQIKGVQVCERYAACKDIRF